MMVIPQKPGEGRREVALLLVSSTSIGYPQCIKVGSHLASKALWLFGYDRIQPIWVARLVN